LWRRWAIRIGLVDDPGARKIHHSPVPLAGGMAVLTGILTPLLLGTLTVLALKAGLAAALKPVDGQSLATVTEALAYGFRARAAELIAIAAGAVLIFAVGWLDDKHELSPARKFAGQFLAALLLAAGDVRITLFVPSALFSYAVTIFWVLTIVNAFNFLDNMNGLCAGLGAVGAATFAVFAARHEQYLVALITFVVLGALLGFLPWNYPRATAFLGDSGSHLIGYILAVLAILPHFHRPEEPRPLAVLAPLVVLAVPLLDMVSVVVYRTWTGKPFYVGDTNHISHRLVRRGLSKPAAVALIWAVAALCGGLALWL
jgi:UDP-GlcNAc:undecaprenyl-phosphate GlcNAc-1-phosphate transferase